MTTAQRLDTLEQLFDQVLAETPYYDWLGFELDSIEPGRLVGRVPYEDETASPAVAPDAMHGGVIATTVDAAAMGAIIAEKGTPVPLVTTDLDVSFHDATTEDTVVEATTVGGEGTLMTARVDVYPESEWERDEGTVTATGTATARILE